MYKGIGIVMVIFCLLCSSCSVMNMSEGRIVVNKSEPTDVEAAELLQKYVSKISGKQLEIVAHTTELKAGDIVLGKANGSTDSRLKPDGFSVSTRDGKLRIQGMDHGVIYGVTDVLEKYFDVHYWAPDVVDIPKTKRLTLPKDLDYVSNPAFEFRHFGSTTDDDLRRFIRARDTKEIFADNLFVHTFRHFVPYDEYAESHPEYFAFYDGKRRPGKEGQLCLSNEDVFNIVVHKVDSIFKANPDKQFISVSQNDGQHTHCRCDKCRAIDELEGSPTGSIIHFVNRVAERFPDKTISTLAYLYTIEPPKHEKPRENVNVMLCNIDTPRQLPMDQTDPKFVEYLEAWSKLTHNFLVWDYGINFTNTVTPFPNFHILAPNIKIFQKNHVNKIFYCCSGYDGKSDYTELRNYLVSKLYWDPDADVEALKAQFLKGYYRDAAPYLAEYLAMCEKNLIDSKLKLWIYDTPASHKTGFLKPELLKEYNKLYDQAEAAVKDQPEVLERVRRTRTSLQLAELEVLRTVKPEEKNIDELKAKVQLLSDRCKHFHIEGLGENGQTAQDFCDWYMKRYIPSGEVNKAKGAKITWGTSPAQNYTAGAEEKLTDGLYGGAAFQDGWVGWEGIDFDFVVDLGKDTEFTTVETDVLRNIAQWVFLPNAISYEISSDNRTFKAIGSDTEPKPLKYMGDGFKKYTVTSDAPLTARYVKVKVDGLKTCPAWHFGNGYKCWVFIDEFLVK